jgi:hypothetical protein
VWLVVPVISQRPEKSGLDCVEATLAQSAMAMETAATVRTVETRRSLRPGVRFCFSTKSSV